MTTSEVSYQQLGVPQDDLKQARAEIGDLRMKAKVAMTDLEVSRA